MEPTMRTAPIALLLAVLLIPRPNAAAQTPVRVHVDSAAGEIVISAGPITIAPAKPYSHHSDEAYHVIDWPATGWMNGYRVDLVDSTGALLSRALIHHAGMANLDRRQLAYPMAERVFAAAHETTPVELPRRLGLPLARGQRAV